MKDELDNKILKPKRNKAVEPSEGWEDPASDKTVKIRINPNRAIAGVGKAGEEVEVSELDAMNFVLQGLATIIEQGDE